MLEQGARQEQQMTRQGHKTNQTGRQKHIDSATSTGSDSDRRGENDNEPAKTIGQGAQ